MNAKGEPAKGITAEYYKPFFKKMYDAARRKLGPGFFGIWLDNATVHRACADFLTENLVDEVVFQPPSSPDTNHCDTGVFVNMQRMVNQEEPSTKDEIRAAVGKAWKQITPAHLRKVSDRVCKNMATIKDLMGGTSTLRSEFKISRASARFFVF